MVRPSVFEPAELVPGGPAGNQVRIRDQDARSFVVCLENPYRLAALNQQRLIVSQSLQGFDNAVIGLPVARRFPRTAVNYQRFRLLRDFRVQIVHQHSKCGLLVPASTADLGSSRRSNGGRLNRSPDRHVLISFFLYSTTQHGCPRSHCWAATAGNSPVFTRDSGRLNLPEKRPPGEERSAPTRFYSRFETPSTNGLGQVLLSRIQNGRERPTF